MKKSLANCKACSVQVSCDWRLRTAVIRRELLRHQLTDRERRIAEIILDKSFGWQQPSVVIPELKHFSSLTGMAAPHVHMAIKGLHLKRIIRVVMMRGQATYTIREDTDNWKVTPRVSIEGMRETMALLRELNELPPEDLKNFKARPDAGAKHVSITELVITQASSDGQILPFLH
jgi:hypothetical protein